MTYLCLAAGKGTRFARLGTYLQKCMYPVGTHPFVEYSVAHLVDSEGCDPSKDRLVFIVGHHADQIVSYFGGEYRGLPIEYVEQHEQLGTGHAVDTARGVTDFDRVIVWLADLFVSRNLFEGAQHHPADSMLTIAEDPEEENDDIRIDVDGRRVSRAWQGSSDRFDIGLWKLGPEVLDRIASTKSDEYRVLLNVQRAIESGAEVGYQIAEEWVHLGGVHPTVEEHIAGVVARMSREEQIFDRI